MVLVNLAHFIFNMCLSPLRIRNPNKGRKDKMSFLYDTESTFINVPCGYCSECIALRQMDICQRCQMEATDCFLYFSTFTYDNDHLPILSTSTGFDIPFADIEHLQKLFKRLRRNNSFGRPFRYFAVSERGGERSRPHFHVLWFLPKYDGESYVDGLSLNKKISDTLKNDWRIYHGVGKNARSELLFTYAEKWRNGKLTKNFDTHFVVPSYTCDGVSSLAFYVSKYLLKSNPKEKRLQQAFKLNLDEDEYESSWRIVKSRSLRSSSFGLGFKFHNRHKIIAYLHNCVLQSDKSRGFPSFFSPDTYQTFPLSHYYKTFPDIYSFQNHLDFVMDKDPFIITERFIEQDIMSIDKFYKAVDYVDSKDFSINLNLDFD